MLTNSLPLIAQMLLYIVHTALQPSGGAPGIFASGTTRTLDEASHT